MLKKIQLTPKFLGFSVVVVNRAGSWGKKELMTSGLDRLTFEFHINLSRLAMYFGCGFDMCTCSS